MKKNTGFQLTLAAILFAGAAILLMRFLRQQREPENMAYYYDLSEKKLFAAPRTSIPPIRGLNNSQQDAVRAVVISTNGNTKDATARKIAYLEMYAPELKAQFESMRTPGSHPAGPAIGHGSAQSYILVRRVDDPNWYSAGTLEAQRIMSDWQVAGSDGKMPIVCLP